MENPYDKFRSDPFINGIADRPKWTVSTKDKMPVDMYGLAVEGRIYGASAEAGGALVTLDVLHAILPDAANYAYRLDAVFDGFAVLDIESKCPADVRERLEKIPCSYRETSMSGKGLHMVFPFDDSLTGMNPDAAQRTVMKEEHGWYEILLQHYVTFTGHRTETPEETEGSFAGLFAEAASHMKTRAGTADTEFPDSIPQLETGLKAMLPGLIRSICGTYQKSPEDFNGDMSRYEFSLLMTIAGSAQLRYAVKGGQWNLKDRDGNANIPLIAAVVYRTAQEMYESDTGLLKYRPKHDSPRHGIPWLYYQAVSAASTVFGNTEKKEE